MNIIYIWIEKYKKLENFQTSFNGKYNIKYNNNLLNISRNKLYLENFFKIDGSDRNINLSAIVGENGTGKSTILDLIVEYIAQGTFSNDFIIALESKGKI